MATATEELEAIREGIGDLKEAIIELYTSGNSPAGRARDASGRSSGGNLPRPGNLPEVLPWGVFSAMVALFGKSHDAPKPRAPLKPSVMPVRITGPWPLLVRPYDDPPQLPNPPLMMTPRGGPGFPQGEPNVTGVPPKALPGPIPTLPGVSSQPFQPPPPIEALPPPRPLPIAPNVEVGMGSEASWVGAAERLIALLVQILRAIKEQSDVENPSQIGKVESQDLVPTTAGLPPLGWNRIEPSKFNGPFSSGGAAPSLSSFRKG
jgi:hypothetical protein